MMRRILVLLTVVAMMVAMLVAMAMPALAAKPPPTKEECLGVQRTLIEGDKLTGQQKQLIRQFESLGECVAASEK
jgi:Spy/CpxP family protein refolding chaperone